MARAGLGQQHQHDRRGDVAPADSYRQGQRVWVHRGSWRPGVVIAASVQAVSVRYRPDAGRGTGVDTVLAADVMQREDADPMTDGAGIPLAGA